MKYFDPPEPYTVYLKKKQPYTTVPSYCLMQMMQDEVLLLMVLVLVVINAIIIGVWQIMDPFMVVTKDLTPLSVS